MGKQTALWRNMGRELPSDQPTYSHCHLRWCMSSLHCPKGFEVPGDIHFFTLMETPLNSIQSLVHFSIEVKKTSWNTNLASGSAKDYIQIEHVVWKWIAGTKWSGLQFLLQWDSGRLGMAQAAVRLNQQLEECDTGLFPLQLYFEIWQPQRTLLLFGSWSCMEGVYSHWLCGFPDQTLTTLYLFWIGSKVLVSFLLFCFLVLPSYLLSVVVHFSPNKGVSILCSTFQLNCYGEARWSFCMDFILDSCKSAQCMLSTWVCFLI